jgi:hypothetical protein
MARAMLYADATVVLPMDFLRVPLTAIAGWLVYSERLDIFTVLGAALILTGNLLNLRDVRPLPANLNGPSGSGHLALDWLGRIQRVAQRRDYANRADRFYLPAAFLRASLMRSCQPGPPCWKYSSTSWSIRSETSSLTPGSAAVFGGVSGTFVVVRLNAASASLRASLRVRGRLG